MLCRHSRVGEFRIELRVTRCELKGENKSVHKCIRQKIEHKCNYGWLGHSILLSEFTCFQSSESAASSGSVDS